MFPLDYLLAIYLRLEANHSKGTIIPNVKPQQSFLSFLVYRLKLEKMGIQFSGLDTPAAQNTINKTRKKVEQ